MEAGHSVCVIEADPLGTVSNWRRRRIAAGPTVETIHDGYALFHRVQARVPWSDADALQYDRAIRLIPEPVSSAGPPGKRDKDYGCRADYR
jgi:hypothetical protein